MLLNLLFKNKNEKQISKMLTNYIFKVQKNIRKNYKSGEILIRKINYFLIGIIKTKHVKYTSFINLFVKNNIENKKYVQIILNLMDIYEISPTLALNLTLLIDHKLPKNVNSDLLLANIKYIKNYYFLKKKRLKYDDFRYIGITNFHFGYMNDRKNNKYIFRQLQNIYVNLDRTIIRNINNKKNINYINKISVRNKKIKILFISKFLSKNHSVFKDRSGIIVNLDKTKYEVFIIMDLFKKHSTKKFWNQFKHLKILNLNFIKITLRNLQNIIIKLSLDIIVFCEIGMCFKQYLLSFSRLASIQCNTFGHSDTSGSSNIDYFISSNFFETEESDKYYSEKLIKLDCLSMVYKNQLKWNLILETKNRFYELLKLSNKLDKLKIKNSDCKLYACFNSFMKFSLEFIETLNKIIIKDQFGVLLINFLNMNHYQQKYKRYLEIFKKIFGKNINRVIFLNEYKFVLKDKLYFIAIKNIDCICETFPFGGLNSTYDVLSVNQAVISLPSKFISGRFTYGIYKKMLFDKTIAKDEDHYIELAYKYANDENFKNNIRIFIKKNKYKVFNEKKSIEEWNKLFYKKEFWNKEEII